ncbi:MAG TPA: MmcQ/YjbR family DNA-binding protein [Lacunisphaera sp.]|nr:MmcQ/YjbR family DNA-binding protein [Lacunisphaera sp.]
MRLDRLKTFALSLPHATFVKQWGENLVFKIGGKMFLIVSLDGETIEGCAFKCTAADYARLTGEVDGIIPARYNMFKSQWVQLEDPDALAETQLKEHIRIAYDLVKVRLPKKAQAELA